MRTTSRTVLYSAVAFAIIAFLLYRPFPPGMLRTRFDKTAMHVIEPFLRITYYWPSRMFSKTSEMIWWTRHVLTGLAPILGPKWDSHGTIELELLEWEGVPVRVYSPKVNSSTGGAVIFIHGGGFAVGNTYIYDSLTKRLATMLHSVVVSIEYRLSPETIYPGQINDCEGVLEHFISIAKEKYNVDTKKIVIMGDSAGGNLAAVITQRRKLANVVPKIAGQVLLYPLLQLVDLQSTSYRYFNKHLQGMALVDPESVALYYMFYAGIDMDKHRHLVKYVLTNGHVKEEQKKTIDKYIRYDEFSHLNYSNEPLLPRAEVLESKEVQNLLAPWLTNPEFSPIMRDDLSDLPKAFIMTCEYDVLRDEGIMYAKRLTEAGVPTILKNYEHGFHAMLNFHWEIEEASSSLDDIVEFTKEVMRTA